MDIRQALWDLFGDLLTELTPDRQAHSLMVGATTLAMARTVPARYRSDLVAAGVLHDVGYSPSLATSGFHPIDGATHLQEEGFSAVVCDLVATHTLATREAAERGLPAEVFTPFVLVSHPDIERLRQLISWADLTTSPDGRNVTVDERLEEILQRYPADHVVHQHVLRRRPLLEQLGAGPPGPIVRPLVVQEPADA